MAGMRARRPSAWLLAVGVLAALFVLAGLFTLLRAGGSGVLAAPTPTPSATPGIAPTSTPDFRATHIAQDQGTQVAYTAHLATRAAEDGQLAGGDAPTGTVQGGANGGENGGANGGANGGVNGGANGGQNNEVVTPDLTATAVSVLLPVIENPEQATATAVAAQSNGEEAAPPTETPIPATVAVVTQTTDLPVVPEGETPTETPVPTPLPTPEPPPTPTPTFEPPSPTPIQPPPPTLSYVVGTLAGVIDRQNGPSDAANAPFRIGPSTIYTASTALAFGTAVTLQARDTTGEWIYLCCAPNSNTPGWVRAASVRPVNNPIPQPPFNNLDPNDTRWLQVRAVEPGLAPLPVNTPAPQEDFPMARRDRGNSGRVPQLPQLPLQIGWDPSSSSGLAGGPYSSGVMVYNDNVVAASVDGHLYSFDRQSGAQRWRFYMGEAMAATPLADSGLVYALTNSGRLIPLTDQGGEVTEDGWAYNMQPHGSPIAAAGRILFTGRANNVDRLLVVDRGNGAVLLNIAIEGANSTAPAAGGQMIFAAGDRVRAYDFFSGGLVWQSSIAAPSFLTPPLYVSPGVEAAAELYVVDSNGILTAFDANTGVILWQSQVGGAADGLAANSTMVVASGNGFLRAFARAVRSGGQLVWQAGIGGRVLGGPLIDEGRVFVGTDAGAFQYFDVSTGALIQGNVASPQAAGAVAVSGGWIYVPSTSGVIFAARQVGQ